MKKCLLLSLILCLLWSSAALAITEGPYDFEGDTLHITLNEKPMFAPADIQADQRALGLQIEVPEGFLDAEGKYDALYSQLTLSDQDGKRYSPGAATSREDSPQLTFYYAVDGQVETDALEIVFAASVPAEYVGSWAGTVDNIRLHFTVEADGSGQYTFEQGGYQEQYPFALAVGGDTFSVDIPEDNQLGISACEGTYAFAQDILTLDVVTTFGDGTTYAYTIPCRRTDAE